MAFAIDAAFTVRNAICWFRKRDAFDDIIPDHLAYASAVDMSKALMPKLH